MDRPLKRAVAMRMVLVVLSLVVSLNTMTIWRQTQSTISTAHASRALRSTPFDAADWDATWADGSNVCWNGSLARPVLPRFSVLSQPASHLNGVSPIPSASSAATP